jgi:tRNA (cmo5U34)-methyltransferase
MTQPPTQVDFDKNPPMPLNEYEQTVKSVNMGYDLTFLLTECFLHALGKSDLHLLVIGVGGGAEIERFLPHHPGWKITGVDPSQQMLAQAQAKVAALDLEERVTLVQGTIEQLAPDMRFDAATCLYVLHFLPDDAKLALLRTLRDRLQPGAPLYLISAVRVDETKFVVPNPQLRADFLGAWQHYGEVMGIRRNKWRASLPTSRSRCPNHRWRRLTECRNSCARRDSHKSRRSTRCWEQAMGG